MLNFNLEPLNLTNLISSRNRIFWKDYFVHARKAPEEFMAKVDDEIAQARELFEGKEFKMNVMNIPEQFELLSFFGSEPITANPEEGFWCYEVIDNTGIKLRFSFNAFQRSLQTMLLLGERILEKVSKEGVTKLALEKSILRGECLNGVENTKLEIQVEPIISVDWSSLEI